MSSNSVITGFDGVIYTVPAIPDKIYNYKYFIFFKHSTSDIYMIWGFNSNSFKMRISDSGNYMYLNFPDTTDFIQCILNRKYSNSWTITESKTSVKDQDANFNVVYLSDNLLNYKDIIITKSFDYLEILELPVMTYALRPIIEEQNISSSDVFLEIFDVLPVLLVVLISFIGIRKGIDYLLNLLRNS